MWHTGHFQGLGFQMQVLAPFQGNNFRGYKCRRWKEFHRPHESGRWKPGACCVASFRPPCPPLRSSPRTRCPRWPLRLGIKSPVSVPLVCTAVRRIPVTCGTHQGNWKRRFVPLYEARRGCDVRVGPCGYRGEEILRAGSNRLFQFPWFALEFVGCR